MRTVRQHRRRHRKILAGGLVIAVGLHVAVFALNPSFVVLGADAPAQPPSLEAYPRAPVIRTVDGRPPRSAFARTIYLTNVNVVGRNLRLRWPRILRQYGEGGSATIGIRLDSDGLVLASQVVEGSGDASKDSAFAEVARAFRYEWRRDLASPRSIELIQPLTVRPTGVRIR